MRKQIFNFFTIFTLLFALTFSLLTASEIEKIYNFNKKNLKENSLLIKDNYVFSISVSKKNQIDDISIKKNRILAEGKILNILKQNIDWPITFPEYLKKAIWKFYLSSLKNHSSSH